MKTSKKKSEIGDVIVGRKKMDACENRGEEMENDGH